MKKYLCIVYLEASHCYHKGDVITIISRKSPMPLALALSYKVRTPLSYERLMLLKEQGWLSSVIHDKTIKLHILNLIYALILVHE